MKGIIDDDQHLELHVDIDWQPLHSYNSGDIWALLLAPLYFGPDVISI